MKNKMDLAIGVAVGSSIQIALFAIPFTVRLQGGGSLRQNTSRILIASDALQPCITHHALSIFLPGAGGLGHGPALQLGL